MTLYDKIVAKTRKRMVTAYIGYDPAIAFQLLCEEVEAIKDHLGIVEKEDLECFTAWYCLKKELLKEGLINNCSSYDKEKQICIDTDKPCDYCFKG
jgi:hypothetical protein